MSTFSTQKWIKSRANIQLVVIAALVSQSPH
jgi:hypothetical protein